MTVRINTERKYSLKGLRWWLDYYRKNSRMHPCWTDNAGVVSWLTEQIHQRELELGIICM